MTPRRSALGRLLTSLLLLALVAIGLGAPFASSDDATVTVGSFVSTSGNGAVYGVDQLQGLELAIRHINEAGGVGGRKLAVKQKDTAYDKTQAQSVMQTLVADKSIIGVIGPTSSAEAFAANPAAVAARLPVIAISNNASGVPQIGPYVHRISVPEETLLPAVATHVVKSLGIKRAAILYAQDDPFASSGFRAFQGQLKKDNVEVTEVVAYHSATTVDFTAQLQRVRNTNPEALFIAAKANDGAVVLRQARQAGMKMPAVGNLAFTSPALLGAAGDAAEGLIVGALWDSSDPSQLNQRFLADYKAAYKRDASPLAATAYNAVYIVKEALERSKDFSREGLQKGLKAMDGYSYLGVRIVFRDLGNGLRDGAAEAPVLLQYKGGRLAKLQP